MAQILNAISVLDGKLVNMGLLGVGLAGASPC